MQNNELSKFDRQLGRKIREARQLRGLTQTELGRALGVSYQQVQKNETGKSRVSAERLDALCKILKTPLSFFLGTSEIPRSQWLFPAETIRLATSINELPSEVIQRNIKSLVSSINTAWRSHENLS